MKSLLGIIAVTFAASSFAAESAAISSLKGTGKYGDAGCGLGSMLFHDQKGIIQVPAATTNGSFGSQTFGISTGTSNCTDNGLVMADKEKEFFASANYESLMQEMAQGKGENLQAMASLFGCGSEAFAVSSKTNYARIFPSPDVGANAMLANLEGVIKSDAALKGACTEYN